MRSILPLVGTETKTVKHDPTRWIHVTIRDTPVTRTKGLVFVKEHLYAKVTFRDIVLRYTLSVSLIVELAPKTPPSPSW